MEDFDIRKGELKRYKGPGGDVVIPEGVVRIGSAAFYYCKDVTSVEIPTGVTSIAAYAFYCCSKLSSVTIPEGVTAIRTNTFYDCSSLSSIKIPKSVMSIGKGAFHGCKGLADKDGFVLVEKCSTLFGYFGTDADVVIPQSVTRIDDEIFSGHKEITNVTLPAGLTSIGKGAFTKCSGLSSVVIPESVTCIGKKAFAECGRLKYIICSTPYVVSHVDKTRLYHLIYLGDAFSDLSKKDRRRVIKGFLYAQEHGITEINRWSGQYLEYIRTYPGALIRKAKENKFILFFAIREKLLDAGGTKQLLDHYENTEDVEVKAALLQYQHEMFETEETEGFTL